MIEILFDVCTVSCRALARDSRITSFNYKDAGVDGRMLLELIGEESQLKLKELISDLGSRLRIKGVVKHFSALPSVRLLKGYYG